MTFRSVFYLVVGFWMLFEIWLQRTHHAAPTSSPHDAGSRKLIGHSIWMSVVAAVLIAQTHLGRIDVLEPDVRIAGLGIIVLGLAIRASAVYTLGHFFTLEVAIATDHHLVRRGLYRWVRHPSYTGMLLSCLGIGLALGNWIATLVLVLAPGLALFHRVRVEERALRDAFPNEYPEYARTTSRLIPGIF